MQFQVVGLTGAINDPDWWKQMPIRKWVNQKKNTMVHSHKKILHSRRKEGAPSRHDSMDRTGGHYAKWNKPGGERQIPYDLTYKWNLINKTNKQAKYNQRHWDKEQTDSNQRGEGYWGKIREGSSRTIYKGHTDKAKAGRIKGGRQGRMGWTGVVGRKCRQL